MRPRRGRMNGLRITHYLKADATAAGALTDTVRDHGAPGIFHLAEAQKCGTVSFSSLRKLSSVELSQCPASGGSEVRNRRIVQPPEAQKCRTVSFPSLRRLRRVEVLHRLAFGGSDVWNCSFASFRRLIRVELWCVIVPGGSDVWNCHIVQPPEAQACGTISVSSHRRLISVGLSYVRVAGGS